MAVDDAGLPGISKQTTRHPPSRKYLPPEDGDEVKVCYSLLVGGEQLETTGTDGLSFTIGAAEVLPQLSLVVQQMYQGEHAEFTMDIAMLQDSGISSQGSSKTAKLQVELVRCPLREDLFGDRGAIKRTIKSSEGRLPKNGDECQVSYSISSEGKETSSSCHEAVYKIGAPNQLGQLAQTIDKSLLSMRLKEEVLVICRPGYVPAGKAGKDLHISLALEEIFQVHDVSLGKHDGSVLRKRLKEGSGPHRLHDTGKVQVRVWTVTSNAEKVSSRPFELTFIAGEGEACDALEGAVLGLKAGDELMLRVMDPTSCEGLLENVDAALEAPVMVHFTMLHVEQVPEKWDLTHSERLKRAHQRRSVAAQLFSAQRVRLAARHYQEISSFLARPDDFKEQRDEALELRRVAMLNEAACMLQLDSMPEVKDLCDKVLKEAPEQPKALYRRAKALVALKEHQAALEDLQRLREVEPKNVAGQKLLREVKEELRKQDRASSKTFSKMCAGLGELPEYERSSQGELVVAPDLEEEYAKLAQETGVPLHRLRHVK